MRRLSKKKLNAKHLSLAIKRYLIFLIKYYIDRSYYRNLKIFNNEFDRKQNSSSITTVIYSLNKWEKSVPLILKVKLCLSVEKSDHFSLKIIYAYKLQN